jgi:competence ComEA-like helix-hairpin-helix protein
MSARTPFSFTHLQKRGIVILLSIISGIFQLQYMYFTWLKPSPNVFHIPDMQDHPVSMQLVEINTATPEEWKKLPGIGSVLSQRIVKYRQAIQGFSEIEDLHSVYGLSDSVWVHIKPYLYLDSTKLNVAKPSSENTFYPKSWSDFEPQTVSPIGINTADTSEWKTLPGIGQVLSKRIVKFRAIKKGFSQIEELKKVYGLPEDTYQQILPYLKLDTFALKMDSTFFEGQDTSSQKPYFTHDTAQSSNSKNHYPAQSYSRIEQYHA